uniref:Uncharacterized protein n=1 Tax=Timema douglasi TaxID=61478 RepID=A0A7R8VWQ9_TIMDO|nr:unnamed protein product [Timema douglasi]
MHQCRPHTPLFGCDVDKVLHLTKTRPAHCDMDNLFESSDMFLTDDDDTISTVMELPKSHNSSELIEDSTIFELNLENEEEQVLNLGSEKSNLQVLTVNAMNVNQDARHLNVSPHGNYTFEFSSVGKNDGLLKMRFNANIDEEYELGAIKKNDETHDHERKDDKTHIIDVGGISESLEHNPTPVDNGDFQGSSSSRVVYTMVVPREELAGASIDVMPSKHLVTIRAQRNNSVCTPASCQLERVLTVLDGKYNVWLPNRFSLLTDVQVEDITKMELLLVYKGISKLSKMAILTFKGCNCHWLHSFPQPAAGAVDEFLELPTNYGPQDDLTVESVAHATEQELQADE